MEELEKMYNDVKGLPTKVQVMAKYPETKGDSLVFFVYSMYDGKHASARSYFMKPRT